MEVVAKSRQTSGNISRQTVPALLLVALNLDRNVSRSLTVFSAQVTYRIWLSGPAFDSMTCVTSPATNSKLDRNTNPVNSPIATQ